ncbi:MAG: alpha-ketoglutarate-dependent dioxygenase AlkB, partial [Flavobacteriales bacterium]|nr:alpha-ketoglutarate-dependent dioxygenase AlkB [Flavobacteriales bacterium]
MTGTSVFKDGEAEAVLFSAIAMDLELAEIAELVNWKQNTIKVFGKEYLEPRLTEYYGPEYQYSSIRWPQQPFPEWLSPLHSKICELVEFPFNSVLLNYYRHGQDSMGWHRDNEPEMDSSLIASVSFGAERVFKIRHRDSNKTSIIPLI